jgi:hypothetical protein
MTSGGDKGSIEFGSFVESFPDRLGEIVPLSIQKMTQPGGGSLLLYKFLTEC